MTLDSDVDLREHMHRVLDALTPRAGYAERVQQALHEQSRIRPRLRRMPAFAAALGVAALVAAFTLALVAGFGLRAHRASVPGGSLFDQGAPAAAAPDRHNRFVWFTAPILSPPLSAGHGSNVTGLSVTVLDWTGALRYQFRLAQSSLPVGPVSLEAITPDGTRALLQDGRVIDETGATVGHLPGVASDNFPMNGTLWLDDGSGVCEAVSNEPKINATPGSSAQTQQPPPWSAPGANHSVTLAVVGLDGRARTVATVGTEALGEGSGGMPDMTSVVSCSRSADIAVIARYHDATVVPSGDLASGQPVGGYSATDVTASLWAVRLSTGELLFHQPETRMALGRPFFFGSLNGSLAVEFLWNSVTAGSEVDRVVHIPSGEAVPVTDVEPSPDTPAVSADGARILRRVVDAKGSSTVLELLDAADGRVIRRWQLAGVQGASAIAEPGGESFMVSMAGQLFLMDQNGNTTVLHPPLDLSERSDVSLAAGPALGR